MDSDGVWADGERARAARFYAEHVIAERLSMAVVRRWCGEDPFWLLVRDEVGFLRARRRWRVIDGGASRHPLAVRVAAVTRPGPRPALSVVASEPAARRNCLVVLSPGSTTALASWWPL